MQRDLPGAGDAVWIRQQRWRVHRVTRDEPVGRFDVSHRHDARTFLTPFDCIGPATRRQRIVRASSRRIAARLAGVVGRSMGSRSIASAIDARLVLMPHQLEPALAMSRGVRRVLVADEVGLGKTIQAGLVIAETIRTVADARVLVIAPATLSEQWSAELSGRFSLQNAMADRRHDDERMQALARDDNPWQHTGIRIASPDYLKQPHVASAIPIAPWDLVVIDEAHLVCGSSARHDACHTAAQRSHRVLLLTATPHDGDEMRFARLMDLGAHSSSDSITVFRRTRADLNILNNRRTRWQAITPDDDERRLFAALTAFERVVIRAASSVRRDAALLLLSVFRKRALSTPSALRRSLARRQQWHESQHDPHEWRQPDLFAADDIHEADDAALGQDIGLPLAHEQIWLRRLSSLSVAIHRSGSKVQHVVELLNRTREPVVVFTEFRHSLEVLAAEIGRTHAVAAIHGAQAPAARSAELSRFLDGHARVLVATDVASVGLNLQIRARWVVNLELPWNPARLEQRAGRVDRIGQTRPVHMTTLVFRRDLEAAVARRIAARAVAARRAIGADVLSVVPDEDWLRSFVFGLESADPPPIAVSRTLMPCKSWRRTAIAHAARLSRCRQLASRWRTTKTEISRPLVAGRHCSLLRRFAVPPGTGCAIVFVVPVISDDGDIVETAVVPVATRVLDGASILEKRVTKDHARACAMSSMALRAERLARKREALAARLIPHEQHLCWHLESLVTPTEDKDARAQQGMFDRRWEDARRSAAEAVAEIRKRSADRLAGRARWCCVSVGDPIAVAILSITVPK